MKEEIPWYSEEAGLFGDAYFRFFGDILTEERTQHEITFIEKVLNLHPGSRILDLCCGHGRHSIELAKRGYDVTGQDLSRNFLKMAEESAQKAGVTVRFVHADMRDISFENEFDAVIMMLTAFGVLGSDEENQKVINGVYHALKSGGRFLLDMANRDKIIRNYLHKDHRHHEDGTIEIIDRKFDHLSGLHIETRKLLYPDGKKEEFTISLRFYTVPELITILKKAGLTFIESYGDLEFSPITFSSPRYLLIAEKK